ncbi:MAG: ABC transporter permease [Pseudomonadota bacterium]
MQIKFNPLLCLQLIGQFCLALFQATGKVVMFSAISLSHIVRPPFYFKLIGHQMINIGYFSLPVVGMTTLFAGMVLALQSYSGISVNLAEDTIPSLVVLAITRELAPVLAGLMVAGRVGASIAAELASMRVSEQIDALHTLSTNPFKYLIVPRLLAGFLMLPLLVLIGDLIGILGGYLVCVYQLNFNPSVYIERSFDALKIIGVISGLVKAAAFGFIIALMGCYQGYFSRGGAQGVGSSTTNAVVFSSILILIFNYMLGLSQKWMIG